MRDDLAAYWLPNKDPSTYARRACSRSILPSPGYSISRALPDTSGKLSTTTNARETFDLYLHLPAQEASRRTGPTTQTEVQKSVKSTNKAEMKELTKPTIPLRSIKSIDSAEKLLRSRKRYRGPFAFFLWGLTFFFLFPLAIRWCLIGYTSRIKDAFCVM